MKKYLIILLFSLISLSSYYSQVIKIPYSSSAVSVIVSGSLYYEDISPSTNDPIFGVVVSFVSNNEDGSSNEAKVLRGTTYYKSNPDTLTFIPNSNTDTIYAFALDYRKLNSAQYPLLGQYFINVNGVEYILDSSNVIYFMDKNTLTNASEIGNYLPNNFLLKQNYPNPFNPSTNIEFNVSKQSFVNISIYDINGKLVNELVNERKNTGNYLTKWNGKDQKGNKVASGPYFYQVQSDNFIETKKMILLK